MKPVRTIVAAFLGIALALPLVTTLNALRQSSRQLDVQPIERVAVDSGVLANRLAGALRFRTIADANDSEANAGEFARLRRYLEQQFPLVHATLRREVVGGHSLLYTWEGSDAQLRPALWIAHQDVVPAGRDSAERWDADPFGGEVKAGYVWGRGAWDNKGNLVAQLEAIEASIAQGVRPRRTLMLAAGHDEEVGGLRGAKAIATLLRSRGIMLDYILDEGMVVTDGVLKGFDRPVALVGMAEKGLMTVRLKVRTHGGHSSIPSSRTAIGQLSAALTNLERNQLPLRLEGLAQEMFETLAPETSGVQRLLLSNLWLFRPLLESQLARTPLTNAMLRTTTALTVIRGGEKENVLPDAAEGLVNFRLMPGHTESTVLEHVKRVVDNDSIEISTVGVPNLPSQVSTTGSMGYDALHRSIREVFPNAVVAPALLTGGTDSKHFQGLCDNVFRFVPVRVTPDDTSRIHGSNERIAIGNYVEMITFYRRLLANGEASKHPGRPNLD